MPVTVEQVRHHLGQGLADLLRLDPLPGDSVLLWAQQHPDGPDWAVPDTQFMEWLAALESPEGMPTLSVMVNAARGSIEISGRRGVATTTSTHTSRGSIPGTSTATRVSLSTASLRQETFRIAADRSDLADILDRAARRYVELADHFFADFR